MERIYHGVRTKDNITEGRTTASAQWSKLQFNPVRGDCGEYASIFLHTTRLYFRHRRSKYLPTPKHHMGFFIILILAGDININPGPINNSSTPVNGYICQSCNEGGRYRWKVQCSDCKNYEHTTCINMPVKTYREIQRGKTWYCEFCTAPCTMCLDPVLNGQKAVDCDICSAWTHSRCGGLSDIEYDTMTAVTNFAYICPLCDLDKTRDSDDSSDQSQLDDGDNSNIHVQSDKGQNVKSKWKGNLLRLLNINFQSINNKKAEFTYIIQESNPDIIAGTETWLDKDIFNAEIAQSGYSILRRDRQNDSHGGVILYYKDTLAVTRRLDLETPGENIWAQVNVQGNKPLVIGVVYKPKHSDIPPLESIESAIKIIYAKKKVSDIIVTGDINQPNIDWDTNSVIPDHYASKVAAERLLEINDEFGMQQMVTEPTRGDSVLDLVITNNPNIVKSTRVQDGLSDHDLVIADFNLAVRRPKKPRRNIYLRNKADIEKIRKDMEDYQEKYKQLNDTVPVQEKWDHLEKEIKRIMDEHVPSKTSTNRRNIPWFNRSLRRRTKKRQKLYNKARQTDNPDDWHKFKEFRKTCRQSLNKARRDYINDDLEASIKDNPKAFWTFMKKLRNENNGIADLRVNNKLLNNSKDKADALNNQFSSVFTKEDTTSLPTLGDSKIPDIPDLIIGEEGVKKQLNNLKPSKAPGPNGIFPWILRMMADELAPILTSLFQQSIDEGSLPVQWRQADICPIFKKGDKTDPSNYRPVSLTSVTCKILEHIIHSHVMKHLERNNILCDNQHGFRAKHSTETQLILTMNDLTKSIDEGKTIHMAILDFAKAFDKVPHRRLLYKLSHYGIRGKLHNWMEHFLTERTQRVVCDGVASEACEVVSGVPQGTVTGPLLFLLFINDLPADLRGISRLFADDCLAYTIGEDYQQMQALQVDLNQLEIWQDKWGMSFNATKCFIMKISNKRHPPDNHYTFCGKQLIEVKSHPYLGVEIDNKLRWNVHMSNNTAKANKILGCLRRNLWFCSKPVKETAYKSLVRPILEYASTAWGPHYQGDIQKLEAVQRKAARFCMGDYHQKSSVTKMLNELGWETLESRRKTARLTMMHKIVNGHVGINKDDHLVLNTEQRTRKCNHTNFKPIYGRLDVYKKSYFPRTIHEWNKLDNYAVERTTIDTFKKYIVTGKKTGPQTTDTTTTLQETQTVMSSSSNTSVTAQEADKAHN